MTGISQFFQGLLLAEPAKPTSPGLRRAITAAKGFILLGLLGFCGWFFAPMLKADFWALDDHEIVRFLPDGKSRLSLREIPAVLREKTELGKSFASPRYRPTYYVLRISELYVWHIHARAWFAARFVMVLASLAILGLVAMRFVGPIFGALLVMLALTPVYWGDTWGRTGPAEQYATLGIALLFGGLALFPLSASGPTGIRRKATVALICLGVVLAAGSKEIFLPVCAVPALFLLWPALRRKLSVLELVALAVSFGYCALIAWTLYAGIKQNGGSTAYGQKLGYDYFRKNFDLFLTLTSPWLLSFAAVLFAAFALIPGAAAGSRLRGLFLRTSISFCLGLLTLLWIVFFYAGAWPTYQYSYDFPGMLLGPCAVGLFYWVLDQSLQLRGGFILPRLGLALLVAVALSCHLRQQSFPAHQVLRVYAERSHRYQVDLAAVAAAAKAHPAKPIVFSVAHPLDGETVFASCCFLRSRDVQNPCFIIGPDLIKIAADNPHWLGAARELNDMAAGTRGFSAAEKLAPALAAEHGGILLRVNDASPVMEGTEELPLRWR